MEKKYKFTQEIVTTIVIDNECECDASNPCAECDAAAWEKLYNGAGAIVNNPIQWEII
jgi:hypothetical protein